MGTLLTIAQQHIERVTLELENDEDFPPFIVLNDHQGETHYVGITSMPEDPDLKNKIADMLTAICLLRRAVEVAFASTAWWVKRRADGGLPSKPPSECSDRVEVAMVHAVNIDGAQLHTAPVVRESGKVGIGLWEPLAGDMAGRFASAIRIGISLGQRLPQEMRELFDKGIAEGNESELLKAAVDAITQTRIGMRGSLN